MSMHPIITAALAEQHRRDMITHAEAHRIARAARASRPARPPMRIIPQLIAAARRPVTRLPLKAAATAGAGRAADTEGTAQAGSSWPSPARAA